MNHTSQTTLLLAHFLANPNKEYAAVALAQIASTNGGQILSFTRRIADARKLVADSGSGEIVKSKDCWKDGVRTTGYTYVPKAKDL